MAQVIRSPKTYDVCIIGSGAGGGTAAKVLTEGGLSVVMLEAGPLLNPAKDYKEHVWPYALPHRGADIGGKARHDLNGEFLAPNGFWEIEGEPYTSAPGSNFRWFRSRIEGGRTNHYGRITLRVSARDFKAKSHDGLGDDWPISYDDLAPWYDKAEAFIGVYGSKENLADAPDGVFMPPPKPRCTETLVKKACDHLNITCIPGRMAILTKPLNGRPGVPLLRAVREGMRERLQLQFQPGDDPARTGDRAFHPDPQRHGAGSHHWQRREGAGGFLH